MKVYLALSNTRATDLVQSAIRLHWQEAVIDLVSQYRLIVPDISRGEYNLVIVSSDYAYADQIDRIAGIHSVSDVPLIVINEIDDDLFVSHALDAGADAVLVSPVSPFDWYRPSGLSSVGWMQSILPVLATDSPRVHL